MADNENKEKNKSKKENKPKMPKIFPSMDDLSNKLLSILDNNYTEISDLDEKNKKFQSIINRELEVTKGYSQGNIIDFTRYLNDTTKNSTNSGSGTKPMNGKDPYTFFSSVAGDLFTVFQDYYKNKYIEIQDLRFISKFIPALGEAVNTTNDYIASADELASSTIVRNVVLPAEMDDESKALVMNEIEKIEKKYNLQKKIKNHINHNALITGTTYVYAISYKKLFEEFSKIKAENAKKGQMFANSRSNTNSSFFTGPPQNPSPSPFNGNSTLARESFIDEESHLVMENALMTEDKVTLVKEALTNIVDAKDKDKINKLNANAVNDISDFTKVDYSIPYPVLESLMGYDNFEEYIKEQEVNLSNTAVSTTGIVDPVMAEPSGNKEKKAESFDRVDDIYIKVMDFKKIIPIKIFEKTIGYYYIHADKKKLNNRMNRTVIPGVLNTLDLNTNKKEEAVRNMIDAISNHVIKEFSLDFVTKNSDFKSAIADCIIFNGITDKNYKIQFIPAEDIIEFKVNEDADGNGTSILADALFPAKMLLSILISKILNYINKAGNKTIIHSYKNSIDPMTSNHTQRIIRNLQESDANFTDILSTNILFSKVGRNTNVLIPQSRDGKKLVEFETLEGQNIELNTEFEKFLEQMAIMATGVPSVIMEYINQIDFAKQITTANIKFANRISSLQSDLEKPITELYYRALMASNMSESLKKLISQTFKVELPKPKILSNNNTNDYLSTIQQMATTLATIVYGENNQNAVTQKDEMINFIVRKNISFIDWEAIDKEKERIEIEMTKKNKIDNSGNNQGGGDMGGGEY